MSKNRFEQSLENLQALGKTEKKIANEENANILDNTKTNILNNILETITAKEPQGKSVALYLSNEIDEHITNLAKQKGVSKSKLVDSVLRQVFLQKD